jgi:hypothetical protein
MRCGDIISAGQYRHNDNDRSPLEIEPISNSWLEQPPHERPPPGKPTKTWKFTFSSVYRVSRQADYERHGRVIRTSLCPSSGYLTNTLSEDAEDKHFPYSDPFKVYEDIFIDVKMWGSFEISDTDLSNIPSVSDFVTKFEQEQDSKPGLPPDVCYFLDLSIFFLKLTRECRRPFFD